MLKSIAEDIRQQFDYGNKITQLIIVNTMIFIAINLVKLGFTISAGFQHNGDFNDVVRWFSLSTDLIYNVKHPWVILTHMFLHVSFWHFLFTANCYPNRHCRGERKWTPDRRPAILSAGLHAEPSASIDFD
jgi:hypothetical protein